MDSRSASRALAASESLVTQRDEIVFRMEEITRALRQAFERRIAQTGLTRTQWRILAYLLREEGQTQSDLARMLDLERATVGQAIDRLEDLGLVERRACPTDRRVWQVHLQAAAYDLVPLLREEADRVHEVTWAGLSDADIAILRALLDRIALNLLHLPDSFEPA
jgi:DNA-binding MarR family transcriptional regulator